MLTMNINEQELVMLLEVIEGHIDLLDAGYLKPLTVGQKHQLRVMKTFSVKLNNLQQPRESVND